MLARYGPQGWWPIFSLKTGASVYRGDAPRNNKEFYEICAGAILTQNIAWINVEKGIGALKREGLLSPGKIMEMDQPSLGQLIRSTGYYNQKAIKLKIFTEWYMSRGGSMRALMKNGPEKLRADLLTVKGVGPETADSILLYGLGVKIFVVDAYTKRIFSRLGIFDDKASYDEVQSLFHQKFKGSVYGYNEFHALIVAHGKDICRNRPLCGGCVLKEKRICRIEAGI